MYCVGLPLARSWTKLWYSFISSGREHALRMSVKVGAVALESVHQQYFGGETGRSHIATGQHSDRVLKSCF